jgi:tetratricopeptide (TPR) repeat protein
MKKILLPLVLLFSFVSFSQTAREHLENGLDKYDLKDYYGAIADYTKAIEINPNSAKAYYRRGLEKYRLRDKNGSCQDARKAQQLGYDATQLINTVCKH